MLKRMVRAALGLVGLEAIRLPGTGRAIEFDCVMVRAAALPRPA